MLIHFKWNLQSFILIPSTMSSFDIQLMPWPFESYQFIDSIFRYWKNDKRHHIFKVMDRFKHASYFQIKKASNSNELEKTLLKYSKAHAHIFYSSNIFILGFSRHSAVCFTDLSSRRLKAFKIFVLMGVFVHPFINKKTINSFTKEHWK